MRIIMGNSGNIIQSCAVGVRRIVAHFWRGNFCGVVTDFFLVCVLQKFALDFFYNTVTIVILLSVIVLFFI